MAVEEGADGIHQAGRPAFLPFPSFLPPSHPIQLIPSLAVPSSSPLTNQGSQNEWCELGEHNRVGWAISFEDLQETRNVLNEVQSERFPEHSVLNGVSLHTQTQGSGISTEEELERL